MALEDIEEFNGDPLYQQVWDHYATGKSAHYWHGKAVLEIIHFAKPITKQVIEKLADCEVYDVPWDELINGAYLSWMECHTAYCIQLLTEADCNPDESVFQACWPIHSIRYGDASTNEEVRLAAQGLLHLWNRLRILAEFLDKTKQV